MAKTSKRIQLRVNIQDRDLERKAKQASAFREKGLGVHVELKLNKREAHRTGDAMLVLNRFVSFSDVPEHKVNALKWNNLTLQTFIHP